VRGCSLQNVGGRGFLGGTYAQAGKENDWMAGVDAAIPWEDLASAFFLMEAQHEKVMSRAS